MFNATDDDDFFPPTASGSNLANLFGGIANPQLTTNYNPSLKYTAPKQPKIDAETKQIRTTIKSQSKVYCAKAVQVHKLVLSAYTFIGKLGLAIIGDEALNSYEIIFYKDKQNVLSRSKLIKSFKFINEKDKSSFTDDTGISYQINFDSQMDKNDFIKELRDKGIEPENVIESVETIKADDITSDSSGTHARANILNRISKVGQSMLPSVGNKPKNSDLSESDSEEVVKAKKVVVRKPKKSSISDKNDLHQQFLMINGELVPVQSNMAQNQQYSLINGQLVPNNLPNNVQTMSNQIMHLPSQMLGMNDPMNVHFSENRTHNSEVRMNISQLSNKLDSVLNELTYFKNKENPENQLLYKIKELELKMAYMQKGNNQEIEQDGDLFNEQIKKKDQIIKELLNDIQIQKLKIKDFESFFNENKDNKQIINDLKKEIDALKQINDDDTIKNLNQTIETQKLKIQDYIEFLHINKAKLKELEEINANQNLKIQDLTEICDANKNNKDLMSEIDNYKLKLKDYDTLMGEHNNLIQIKETIQEENKANCEIINNLQTQIENQKLKLLDFDEYLKLNPPPNKLEAAKLHEDKIKDFTENVKSAMNKMYQNILVKVIDDNKLSDEGIIRILSQNMKNATFEIIHEFKNNVNKTEIVYPTFDDFNTIEAPPPIPEFEVTV